MIKSIVVHDIDMDHIAAMERWYNRDHAPEINRRFGPWLARFPFVEPNIHFVSSFILERPNNEYWRDSRGYL